MMKMTEHMPPAALRTSVEGLATSLLEAEPIATYYRARRRLEQDTEAQTLLAEYTRMQSDFRVKQVHGTITQEDIDSLKALDQKVRASEVIMEYATAQQVAVMFLTYVNAEISELLGVDFTALASAGSC